MMLSKVYKLAVISNDSTFVEELTSALSQVNDELPIGLRIEIEITEVETAREAAACLIDTAHTSKVALENLWEDLSDKLPTAIVMNGLESELPSSVRVQCIELFEKKSLDRNLLLQFLRRTYRETRAKSKILWDVKLNKLVADFATHCIKALHTDQRLPLEQGLSKLARFHNVAEVALYSHDLEKEQFRLLGSSLAYEEPDARHGYESWKYPVLPWLAEQIFRGKRLVVNNIASLPVEAEKERWEWSQRGVQSLVLVPISVNGQIIGEIFATAREKSFSNSPGIIDALTRAADPVKEFLQSCSIKAAREQKVEELKQEALNVEERYHCILESINMGFMIGDEQGRFIHANQQAAKLLGRDVAELIGRKAPDIFYPPELRDKNPTLKREFEKHSSLMKSRFEDRMRGQAENYRDKVFLPNGEVKILRVHAGPLRMADGSIVGSVRLDYDITERARLEEELMQSYKYLRFREVSRLLTRELALLSTLISSKLELSKRLDVEQQSTELIEVNNTVCFHLHHLCLLIEGRRYNAELIDLNRFISETEFLLGAQLPEGSSLRLTLDELLPRIKVDPGHLQQIIFSLLFSHIDILDSGEDLLIRSHFHEVSEDSIIYSDRVLPGNYVSLTIGDTRVGVSEMAQSIEIETEKKGDASEELFGLASLAGVVKEYGGSVTGYFVDEKRKSISVYFPVHTATTELSDSAEDFCPVPVGAQALLVGETQEFNFIETLKRQIQSLGFNTELSIQPRDVLEALDKSGLQLVVAEEYLLARDDFKLYKAIQERRPDLRILVINDSLRAFSGEGRFPSSIVEYLDIPFTADSLRAKISGILERQNNGSAKQSSVNA